MMHPHQSNVAALRRLRSNTVFGETKYQWQWFNQIICTWNRTTVLDKKTAVTKTVTNDGTSPARKESRKCNRCKTPPHQSPPARSHLPTQISPKVGGALGILLASTLAPLPPPLPPLRPPPPLRVHTPRHLTICCSKIKSTDKSSISQSVAHTNVLEIKRWKQVNHFLFLLTHRGTREWVLADSGVRPCPPMFGSVPPTTAAL